MNKHRQTHTGCSRTSPSLPELRTWGIPAKGLEPAGLSLSASAFFLPQEHVVAQTSQALGFPSARLSARAPPCSARWQTPPHPRLPVPRPHRHHVQARDGRGPATVTWDFLFFLLVSGFFLPE